MNGSRAWKSLETLSPLTSLAKKVNSEMPSISSERMEPAQIRTIPSFQNSRNGCRRYCNGIWWSTPGFVCALNLSILGYPVLDFDPPSHHLTGHPDRLPPVAIRGFSNLVAPFAFTPSSRSRENASNWSSLWHFVRALVTGTSRDEQFLNSNWKCRNPVLKSYFRRNTRGDPKSTYRSRPDRQDSPR